MLNTENCFPAIGEMLRPVEEMLSLPLAKFGLKLNALFGEATRSQAKELSVEPSSVFSIQSRDGDLRKKRAGRLNTEY